MTKRKPIVKNQGISGSHYDYYQEQERRKHSIGFNVGPDTSKTGRMKSYYVTSEDWHHKQLSHGMARGQKGVKEAKRFTRNKYPHMWIKYNIRQDGWVRKKEK